MPDVFTTSEPRTEPDALRLRGTRAQGQSRPSILGVLGELLITGGVLVLLFLAWQLWWNDLVVAGQQRTDATELSQSWEKEAPAAPASTADTDEAGELPAPEYQGEPVVAAPAGLLEDFGVLYIPRFAEFEENYSRVITEGIDHTKVLNAGRMGHYPDTQMPGEIGNFVIAAHRSAWGGGLHWITDFELGDAIYVSTADGYYTYRFRDLEFVEPTAVDVLAPVPRKPEVEATNSLITLTTCNPLWSTAERVIAYGVFESFTPRSAGAPAEIAETVAEQGK